MYILHIIHKIKNSKKNSVFLNKHKLQEKKNLIIHGNKQQYLSTEDYSSQNNLKEKCLPEPKYIFWNLHWFTKADSLNWTPHLSFESDVILNCHDTAAY